MVLGRFLLLALLFGTAQAGGAGHSKVCGTAPVIDVARVERQLSAAQALWQKRGPEEYGLTTEVTGQLGLLTTEVQVERGVVSGRTTATSPPVGGKTIYVRMLDAVAAKNYTVPGLFKYVGLLLEGLRQPIPRLIPGRPPVRPSPWRPCGLLAVSFDPADGHLRSLKFDASGVIDEEFTLTTSPITVLPK